MPGSAPPPTPRSPWSWAATAYCSPPPSPAPRTRRSWQRPCVRPSGPATPPASPGGSPSASGHRRRARRSTPPTERSSPVLLARDPADLDARPHRQPRHPDPGRAGRGLTYRAAVPAPAGDVAEPAHDAEPAHVDLHVVGHHDLDPAHERERPDGDLLRLQVRPPQVQAHPAHD